MALTLASCVRVTTKRSAVWRQCACCGVMAPLAPHENRCTACQTRKPKPRRAAA
jgi:hypothetical protein